MNMIGLANSCKVVSDLIIPQRFDISSLHHLPPAYQLSK